MAKTLLFDESGKQTRRRTFLRPLHQRHQHSGITKGVTIPKQRWQPLSFPFGRFHICKARDFVERVLHILRRRARRDEELAPQRLHAGSRERRSLPKSELLCQSSYPKRIMLTRYIKPDSLRSARALDMTKLIARTSCSMLQACLHREVCGHRVPTLLVRQRKRVEQLHMLCHDLLLQSLRRMGSAS